MFIYLYYSKMVRILAGHIILLLVGVANGFVPPYSPFRERTSSLAARYSPPPPPAPPTPEPGTIERLIQEATKALSELSNKIHSPQPRADVSSLPEQILGAVKMQMQSLNSAGLQEQISSLRSQMDVWDATVLQQITVMTNQLQSLVDQEYPLMSPVLLKLQTMMPPQLQLTSGITLILASVLSLMFAGSLVDYYQRGPSQPYPTGRYDADAARAYFDRRLFVAMARGFSILLQSLQFGGGVLSDMAL